MPTTYIIDQKGIVREVNRGFESGDEKTVEKLVKKLL
jgi:peroxiredoxin